MKIAAEYAKKMTREEYLDLLGLDEGPGYMTRSDIVEIAEDAIKFADSHPLNPWKSVKEELPKEIKYESITLQGKREFTYSEDVIVLASTGKVFMTNLRNGKWNCSRYDTDGFDIEITHWMPIPELPKEDTK